MYEENDLSHIKNKLYILSIFHKSFFLLLLVMCDFLSSSSSSPLEGKRHKNDQSLFMLTIKKRREYKRFVSRQKKSKRFKESFIHEFSCFHFFACCVVNDNIVKSEENVKFMQNQPQ
jgi:hypothetical protein